MLIPQLDPLTEQQLAWICSLQESSQQAEEALSQGLEQLQQSLTEIIAAGSLADDASAGDCMAQMALALSKLSDLRGFVHQVGPQLSISLGLPLACSSLNTRPEEQCFFLLD